MSTQPSINSTAQQTTAEIEAAIEYAALRHKVHCGTAGPEEIQVFRELQEVGFAAEYDRILDGLAVQTEPNTDDDHSEEEDIEDNETEELNCDHPAVHNARMSLLCAKALAQDGCNAPDEHKDKGKGREVIRPESAGAASVGAGAPSVTVSAGGVWGAVEDPGALHSLPTMHLFSQTHLGTFRNFRAPGLAASLAVGSSSGRAIASLTTPPPSPPSAAGPSRMTGLVTSGSTTQQSAVGRATAPFFAQHTVVPPVGRANLTTGSRTAGGLIIRDSMNGGTGPLRRVPEAERVRYTPFGTLGARLRSARHYQDQAGADPDGDTAHASAHTATSTSADFAGRALDESSGSTLSHATSAASYHTAASSPSHTAAVVFQPQVAVAAALPATLISAIDIDDLRSTQTFNGFSNVVGRGARVSRHRTHEANF
ncbi:hypothetical protein FISHEDRAFT_73889 [Fistulina hepatica ATCC 64428]|uniref:Uncharacterized protein n=1 Tax=Fistulina hepatica ATCC 64428 TaxID=1128425 RepID=A0A0D7ACH0_9AGAR|nr:hypothetical protein FISHEDRAFT_73889 [Fistulina hepatica ATCC 64428]